MNNQYIIIIININNNKFINCFIQLQIGTNNTNL